MNNEIKENILKDLLAVYNDSNRYKSEPLKRKFEDIYMYIENNTQQLLAEQDKNKELIEALEKIKTKYEPYIAYLQVVEDIAKALNEVNK